MKTVLVKKTLPQNPNIWVSVPDYKEPILPVSGGFGWYGLQAYDFQGDKLMCHECGEFWDSLGYHIAQKHKLTTKEYRRKYGLMDYRTTRFTSDYLHEKLSNVYLKDIDRQKRISQLYKTRKPSSNLGKTREYPLELYNKHDTCRLQLLRLLSDCAEHFGVDVSLTDTQKVKPGICAPFFREFGSFNKAKQLLKLKTNACCLKNERQYTKQIILEDMCLFYSEHHHWPKGKDYDGHKMMCSRRCLELNGGLTALRLEAQQLKETQEANRIQGEQAIKRVRQEFLAGQPS